MNEYQEFVDTVWEYYHAHGRELPWRNPEPDGTFDPYKIMVSELMLQQTQVSRVVPKYQAFITRFPNVESLATAPLADVLALWSGLGYNRRAKFLWQAAQLVPFPFPRTVKELVALPGIGVNTAGAILAYAHNQPTGFIETNIRTVYIHHFFPGRTDVDDTELLPIVMATLDQEHVREWYWALMDYGVFLKTSVGNTAQNSKHYTKQTAFQGSKRQIRGQVIRMLTNGPQTITDLETIIPDERLPTVIKDLLREQLVRQDKDTIRL